MYRQEAILCKPQAFTGSPRRPRQDVPVIPQECAGCPVAAVGMHAFFSLFINDVHIVGLVDECAHYPEDYTPTMMMNTGQLMGAPPPTLPTLCEY